MEPCVASCTKFIMYHVHACIHVLSMSLDVSGRQGEPKFSDNGSQYKGPSTKSS